MAIQATFLKISALYIFFLGWHDFWANAPGLISWFYELQLWSLLKTKWRVGQRSTQNTWLQVTYFCTDGFNLEILPCGLVMQRQIVINVIIFVAYMLHLPLNTHRPFHRSQRTGKLGLDFGSWQSPDISCSHLYRGTIAWTPPTAIYREYTVYIWGWDYWQIPAYWVSQCSKQCIIYMRLRLLAYTCLLGFPM